MKNVLSTMLSLLLFSCFSFSSQKYEAQVIGSINLGSQEITYLYVSILDCQLKTIPHDRGVFNDNEIIIVSSTDDINLFEVEKSELEKTIFTILNFRENFLLNTANEGIFTISCAGSYDCYLARRAGSKETVSCSCDDCSITLRYDEKPGDGGNSVTIPGGSSMEVPMLQDYLEYAEDILGDLRLNKVVVFSKNEVTVSQFFYTNELGEKNSVMISKTANQSFVITGNTSCVCKEVYDFVSNKASCSCDDCQMTVEVK